MAIINPIGALPVYLSLAPDQQAIEVPRTARMAAIAVFITLTLFMVFGQHILDFFSISLASFRVGGGILLLLMAISMLHGQLSTAKHTKQEALESTQKETIAVVPLAIPILSGPGAISTVIILSHQAFSWPQKLILFVVIVICTIATYAILRLAKPLNRLLGLIGSNIATRVMGLILSAIAVEFIAEGIKGLMPGFAAP